MSGTLPKTMQEIDTWLRAQAQARHVNARIYTDHAQRENGWLHVPVYIEGVMDSNTEEPGYSGYIQVGDRRVYPDDVLDAYAKASILQDLEDSWNDREPRPKLRVLLIPAPR